LPIKHNTNETRKQNRKDNLQLARDSTDSKEARKYYQRSVSITAEMIKGDIILLLKL
jgi:5'-3' exonuclease